MANFRHRRGAKRLKNETCGRAYRIAWITINDTDIFGRPPYYRETRRCWKDYRKTQWRDSVCR